MTRSARNADMVKALRLVQMMQGKSMRPSAPVIARELGVSVRTAHRWIAAANEAHIAMPYAPDGRRPQ